MSWFYIFRQLPSGHFQEIARAKYYPDALSIMENWHCGYIASGGDIIFQKNVNL